MAKDVETAYAVDLPIPADFAGKKVFLRFDGVYSYSRLWVNGVLIRDHQGGFTTWYADITAHVTPGTTARVALGVTDRGADLSWGSNYAHHPIGGVLRDITLVALPTTFLSRVHTDTVFDANFVNATLSVTLAASVAAGQSATVTLALKDPSGSSLALSPATATLNAANTQVTLSIPISAPLKWEAEHPHLYTLTTTMTVGSVVETVTQKVGFRQVGVTGNQLFVNGKPVHLLGVCHHSVSAEMGRSATDSLEEQTVRLYKEANCNLIHTSHYPPTPALLDWADELGLFVEVEAPVCFQNPTVQNSAYAEEYITQYAEMLERDRSHASVIEWSVGNESISAGVFGQNLYNSHEYSKRIDPSRPTVYEDAYQNNGGRFTDIYAGHYPTIANASGNATQPIQYGEFAHVACYNTSTLALDPGVREGWARSISAFAQKFRTTAGVVGGAIWAAIDDVFLLPSGPVGFGEWGIIDLYRRRKPEFWHTQKAFSPVQIADGVLTGQTPGGAISIPVKNWYDFTDLSELTFTWAVGARSGTLAGVSLAPRQSGTLTIPAGAWSNGDQLHLIVKRGARLVDEYRIWLGSRVAPTVPSAGGTAPTVQTSGGRITITGVDEPFTVVFDVASARLVEATAGGKQVLQGGPDIFVGRSLAGPWTGTSASVSSSGGKAIVSLAGTFGPLGVSFQIVVDGRGLLTTTYTLSNPHSTATTDVGVGYTAVSTSDTLSWVRDAHWTAYPEGHLGRPVGTAVKRRASGADGYRSAPSWSWEQDTHSYYLFGKNGAGHWTNDFRAARTKVRTATLRSGESGPGVRVESAAVDSVRLGLAPVRVIDDASSRITYTGAWTRANFAQGYTGPDLYSTESFSNTTGNAAQLTFTGTQVGLYAVRAMNSGIIRVILDGGTPTLIDTFLRGKAGGALVYTSPVLTYGQHTLRVEVTGQKNQLAEGTWAIIDAFRVVSSIIDDASDQITYTGTWGRGTAADPWTVGEIDRTESFSNQTGAIAEHVFIGTGVRVLSPKGPNCGYARVSVDGAPEVQVDLYSPTKIAGQNIFESLGLSDAQHKITVKVAGDKRSASTGTFVTLDAFEIVSPDPMDALAGPVDIITSAQTSYHDLVWGNDAGAPIILPANYTATAALRLLPAT
ncbi:glycoside hydrolase family 2 TIM barrel-domain containing protein [Microbacterium sp. CR_7]|uniref:glycoside hydrolase family 2 TIM barrel-domain containing protein n=1 Tax=Microbacterium sp. CR_7 TaxID=3055792 RepID=UPI0035C0F552